MIKVTRLNGKEFYVNSDLIEFVESTPDTVITMTTGKKIVVHENVHEVIDRIIKFKREVFSGVSISQGLDK
ncbi:MAG: flagellar FlbD family protein [Xylanivirga thermophila]|jgi:flagellar protein FlbD|uniref:flagellar FlbD family protein n=1 Tax=Xylanivirga thermophila TaxID=2496273 RepID=UPI00101D2EB9|nr:flagellar FlbD family protein [Xylanivirga thermophila]